VKLLTLENTAAVTDWLFLQSLEEIGVSPIVKGQHSAVYYDLDLISELDPAYFDVYQIAGNVLNVIDRDGEGAKQLLLKASAYSHDVLPNAEGSIREGYWQNPWQIYVLLAYTYLFHLDDMLHASEAFQEAALSPGSPEYLQRLARRLKRMGGEYEVGIKLLGFMIQTATVPRVRVSLEQKRKDLFVAQYVFDLNQSFMHYLKLQPLYNSSGVISAQQMDTYFKDFVRHNQISRTDPWGGEIGLGEGGKIITATPYQSVFGLK
jgi:hypothetical protein